jgi:uncharacterized protein (DUF2062 family)
MPRPLFVKFRPFAQKLRNTRLFRLLGPKLTDPRLWSLNRRAITIAFGTGVGLSFIPLPIHLPAGLIAAMIWHLNVPTLVVTSTLVNPFTAVPLYFFAYRVGVLLLGTEPGSFGFELSWSWLQNGLGAIWKPFLLGCLVLGIGAAIAGYVTLGGIWHLSLVLKYHKRKEDSARRESTVGKK